MSLLARRRSSCQSLVSRLLLREIPLFHRPRCFGGSQQQQKQPAAAALALPPADAAGVTNTLNDFMLALDQGDTARFADLFVAPSAATTGGDGGGGSCEVVKLQQVARTRAELEGLCAALHGRFAGALHFEHNHVIRAAAPTQQQQQQRQQQQQQPKPDACTNQSYWQAVRDGEAVSYGIHVDELERDPGSGLWLFRRRRVFHVWTKDGGAERDRWSGVDL